MEGDDTLTDVLSEFVRTMLSETPVHETLERLVELIVEVTPITAAAVTLMSSNGSTRYVAASSGSAVRWDTLQSTLGRGPCVSAFQEGEAVAVPDLNSDPRFPGFREQLLGDGLAAAFAFPLSVGDHRLGALALYREDPGALEDSTMKAARTLADVTAAYLKNAAAQADLQTSLERSREFALHDPLTGLANRPLLFEVLERALARHRSPGPLTCVMFCDLDGFKAVNDTFGHRIGDELLVSVTDRLKRLIGPNDTVARLAGDEFVVVCEEFTDRWEAEMIAARVVGAVGTPVKLSIGTLAVTISVGIAFADEGGVTTEDLLQEADIAMYEAKRGGGAQFQVFRPDDHHPSGRAAVGERGLPRCS